MRSPIIPIILKQLSIWVVTTFLLIVIIFIPRDVVYETSKYGDIQKVIYDYKLEKHIANIKDFFINLKTNHGLGTYYEENTIEEHIIDKSSRSLKLIIPALLLGFFLGILKGMFDFVTKDRKLGIGNSTTWLMLSIPDLFFMISIQLTLMFLYEIGLLPHIDLYGHEKVENLIVCIVFLAIYPLLFIANMTYTSLIEEESKDYIITAKSKGISRLKIIRIHMLKNAFQKILVNSNTMTLYMLSNLFIVEFLTNYRGAAFYFFQAISTPNTFVVGTVFSMNLNTAVGFTIIFTLIIFFSNAFFHIINYLMTPKGNKV